MYNRKFRIYTGKAGLYLWINVMFQCEDFNIPLLYEKMKSYRLFVLKER